MYNTKYVCQYNSDIFLDTDDINEETKDRIVNILYRNDILHIFDIDDYDEQVIDTVMRELYEKLKINEHFYLLMQTVSIKITGKLDAPDIGLLFLYSFDYLYVSHVCISELLETGEVSKTNLDKLHNLIG